MNYTDARRLLLKVFIGFLSLTAVVAIVSVLSGKFGELQAKVLATTLSITAGSICAMCCAAYLERKGATWAGTGGIIAAVISVLMVIVGVWAKLPSENYWKATSTGIVAGVALAHGCLLRLPRLAEKYRWTQNAAAVLIALLAVQIAAAFWGEIAHEAYYRGMAALSVLVVLVTLVIPICSRLGSGATAGGAAAAPADGIPDSLVLRKVSVGVFADEAGRRYQVTAIAGESPAPPVA